MTPGTTKGLKRIGAAAALAALLAACGRGDQEAAAATAQDSSEARAAGTAETPSETGEPGAFDVAEAVIEPDPGAPGPDGDAQDRPLELDLSAEHVEITISMPPAAARDPELYDALREQAEAEAEESRKIAVEEAEYAREQGFPVRDHFLEILWRTRFEDADLVSLLKRTGVYQGGAHPNTYYESRNWLYGEHTEFGIEDLIADPAGYEAISAHAREAIMDEKRERLGEGLGAEDYWTDQVMDATAPLPVNFELFTLVPSAGDAAKAGGMTLHYSPYALGAYAEGDYHIVIPQSVFAEYLSADYAPLFAGEPRPEQDPQP